MQNLKISNYKNMIKRFDEDKVLNSRFQPDPERPFLSLTPKWTEIVSREKSGEIAVGAPQKIGSSLDNLEMEEGNK